MPGRNMKRAMVTLSIVFLLVTAALAFNSVGYAAYAVQEAVISAVDRQLPTPEQIDASAEANRRVARKSLPAVVHIILYRLRRELESEPRRQSTRQGSGVIIKADEGIILTISRLVGDADEIEVRLHDGRKFNAELIGADKHTGVAVIKIDADNLFQLPIGDSDLLTVGQPVMTIGNPFGYEGSVSKGIVSDLDNEGFIQTDAVMNPGNGGGPLVNMSAEIVGICAAIRTTTGSFNGIGLAIPSSRFERVLPSLMRGEKVVRGYLGVMMSSVSDAPDIAGLPHAFQELGWSESYGVHVSEVLADSPADESGIREEDILVNFNGVPITSTTKLTDEIAYTSPGDRVVFDIWRDKHTVRVQVVVGRLPQGFSTSTTRSRLEPRDEKNTVGGPVLVEAKLPELGIEVRVLNKRLVQTYELQDVTTRGVVVTGVDAQEVEGTEQIKRGDVIVAVNGNSVRNVRDLKKWLAAARNEGAVDLRLRNRKGTRHVSLQLR